MRIWQKIRDQLAVLRGRPALDALLTHSDPDQPLAARLDWAEDLFAWVRRDTPDTRLKLLLILLSRQPESRERFAQTLRSILRDTRALDLFAETGLPQGAAFGHELVSRIFARVLPKPPGSQNLDDLFDRLFPRATDADWLEALDPEIAAQFMAFFQETTTSERADGDGLRANLEDALMQLADRVCVAGSSREVRGRLPDTPFRELPFQKLPPAVELLLEHSRKGAVRADLTAELNLVRALVDRCHRTLEKVTGRLERTGVNTALVYDLARLQAQLHRLVLLLEAWATPEESTARTLMLVADLVRQNHARKSVLELFRQNLHLLTRRIVERNADTGEHYVARNLSEYLAILRSAAGGGALTGITTVVKLLIAKVALAEFFKGAAFGLNYAVSFVALQICGFTLATKQPASTAPALARRMEGLRNREQIEAAVDEVVFLIRSQTAAVFGNLALVIPATLLVDFVFNAWRGRHVLDASHAATILQSLSPLSGAWLFAVFTGVLLWLSSLIAAWMDNWFVLHQLEPALAQHRALQRWLGPTRTRHWAHWLGHNMAGLAGNISLGFLLGLAPEIMGFFGLPLDVRHVTLSTGQATAAFAALGAGRFFQWATLGTMAGILGIGILNIAVSFGLAMLVAVRARNVRGPEREQLLRALANRIFRRPLSFIFPTGASADVPVGEPRPE